MKINKYKQEKLLDAIIKYRIKEHKRINKLICLFPKDFFFARDSLFPEMIEKDTMLSQFTRLKDSKGLLYEPLYLYKEILNYSKLNIGEYMDKEQIIELEEHKKRFNTFMNNIKQNARD